MQIILNDFRNSEGKVDFDSFTFGLRLYFLYSVTALALIIAAFNIMFELKDNMSKVADDTTAVIESPGPLHPVDPSNFKHYLPTAEAISVSMPIGSVIALCAHIPTLSAPGELDRGFTSRLGDDGLPFTVSAMTPSEQKSACANQHM